LLEITTSLFTAGQDMQAEPVKAGSMRELMPETACIVDWLRAQLGQERADKIIRRGMQGQGSFWAQERGNDGVLREFGSRNTSTRWPKESA
jgi:hypothetical protein